MSASKDAAAAAPATNKETSTPVIRVMDVEKMVSLKAKRSGTRMKLLNDVTAKAARPKQEKRTSIKILNNDEAQSSSKGSEKRATPKTVSPGVKILNEKRITPSAAAMETAKIKTSPSKKKKMDHYVLQAIKSENSKADNTTSVVVVEDDDTIDFILADDDVELGDAAKENGEEFVVSGVEDDDDDEDDDDEDDEDGSGGGASGAKRKSGNNNNNELKEMVEHVCGKCYKTFRRVKSLKKHLEFCRYDSGYHLRKADMLKNLDKIERDAVVMEKKDICFCCSESYDTFHVTAIPSQI